MSAKTLKILIVEDEKSMVDLLTAKLVKEGYNVESAPNGKEGFETIKTFGPDLILLDIEMPVMDGYEVLEKMNEQELTIPVIIISNSGQPVEIEKTKKLGAVGHLIKTEFSPQDVLNKINECVDSEGNIIVKDEITLNMIKDENARDLGVKVLLVEDDSFLREICGKKLAKEGYTVFEAVDGNQALSGVESVVPDIVLLDIILPAVDGFQILNNIRASKNEKVAKVPIIMLSNLGQDDDIKKAMDMGANDYLVKAHFTTEEIVEKIKGLLGK